MLIGLLITLFVTACAILHTMYIVKGIGYCVNRIRDYIKTKQIITIE